MVELFNVWSPYLITPDCLSFDITPAEAEIVRVGSDEFVLSCLQACGISAKVKGWNVECVRQSYYSDYLHSSDWRSRWDIAWIFEVHLASIVKIANTRKVTPYKIDCKDETSEGYDEPVIRDGPALLIVTFIQPEISEEVVAKCIHEWQRDKEHKDEIITQYRYYSDGSSQARVYIKKVKFPSQIEDLESLQASLRHTGGSTNWRETI